MNLYKLRTALWRTDAIPSLQPAGNKIATALHRTPAGRNLQAFCRHAPRAIVASWQYHTLLRHGVALSATSQTALHEWLDAEVRAMAVSWWAFDQTMIKRDNPRAGAIGPKSRARQDRAVRRLAEWGHGLAHRHATAMAECGADYDTTLRREIEEQAAEAERLSARWSDVERGVST